MNSRGSKIIAPPFSRQEIITLAESFTKRFAKAIEPEMALVYTEFDAIYERFIYPEYEVKIEEEVVLGFDETGEKDPWRV